MRTKKWVLHSLNYLSLTLSLITRKILGFYFPQISAYKASVCDRLTVGAAITRHPTHVGLLRGYSTVAVQAIDAYNLHFQKSQDLATKIPKLAEAALKFPRC